MFYNRGETNTKENCDFLKKSPLQVIQKARGRAESNGFQTVCDSSLRRVQTVYDLAEKVGLLYDLNLKTLTRK